jgi:large subunit ribosomal protein L24
MRLTLAYSMRYLRRYIERELTHEHLRRQWHPLLGWKEMVKKNWEYSEHRPWTAGFKQANPPCARPKQIYVEPIKEWKVFKGDRVEILVGKDKGKHGLVNCTIKERNWVFVEGLNCEFLMRTQGPNAPPVCLKNELPLLVTTQVKLVDPSDNRPTEVTWRYTEKGERVRVSVRSGRIIPLPSGAKQLEDLINPLTYVESDKDTKEDDLVQVTFKPKLCSFEEEIMSELGIVENRKPAKTYWY